MSEELISAYDIRGSEKDGLTVELAWNVGKALADWLSSDGGVVVVYVPQRAYLSSCVMEGLRLQGRDVIDGGNGDREAAKAYIATHHLAGAAAIGYDELEDVTVIELYNEEGRLVTSETGLREIRNLVEAGNFVPAAKKGEVREIA